MGALFTYGGGRCGARARPGACGISGAGHRGRGRAGVPGRGVPGRGQKAKKSGRGPGKFTPPNQKICVSQSGVDTSFGGGTQNPYTPVPKMLPSPASRQVLRIFGYSSHPGNVRGVLLLAVCVENRHTGCRILDEYVDLTYWFSVTVSEMSYIFLL